MERTLTAEAAILQGKEISLFGWVNAVRNHGKIIFIDLRDRAGVVQVFFHKSTNPEVFEIAKTLNSEDVIKVDGMVNIRSENTINQNLETGTVEIEAKLLEIISKAKVLPFPIDTDGSEINEELRLKYRYLDLRRDRLTKNIKFRSKFVQKVREYLFGKGFTEIETPILTKSTPEGARDFLVPSRLQPGKFYALPQSPQQYKQLLMVAGFERYFQTARCLRDEDLRADRGFEHTQIDIEMSFIKREDIMSLIEDLAITVVESMGGKIMQKPFPIFTYKEAMAKFGADKFDLRNEEQKKAGLHAFAWVIDFPFFEKDKDGNWTFTHNPFSEAVPEDKEAFMNGEIEKVKTNQYDLVWNGYEAGGGSIRGSDPKILEKVFEVLGYSKEEAWKKFGHMLEAFTYGAPTHGGIALGVDRWVMCLKGEKSIRDVQAFPQTSLGTTSVMDAPSEVSDLQLLELGISVVKKSQKPLLEQIVELLDLKKVKYKLIEHKEVLTSEEAAKERGTKLSQGAKALIMKADKKPLMIVLPADRKLDFKKLKSEVKIKDLEMANPEEVKKISGVSIGAVPPFGNLLDIPLYVDTHLGEEKEIAFNAGSHSKSIIMQYSDFEKIAKPVVGDYSA